MHHLDETNMLTDTQHGFRQRRSCEFQLILLVQDLAKSRDKRSHSGITLFDFSKAFDSQLVVVGIIICIVTTMFITIINIIIIIINNNIQQQQMASSSPP